MNPTYRPLANPAPLGLLGFALTTWLLSMVNAGWFAAGAVSMVLAMAFAFGGAAQFVAGVCELPRNNTFGFVAFCSYGSFWLSFALFVTFFQGAHGTAPASFVAWYLTLWGVFTLMMWVGSLAIGRAVSTIFGLLWVTFFLLAAADFTGNALFKVAGGYFGLATALAAFYLAAAEILEAVRGHEVLPMGRVSAPAPVAAVTGRFAAA